MSQTRLINSAVALSQTNSAILKQVLRNKTDKTGWINSAPVTLSFVDGTRTFTITPTGSTFEYWIQGQKFIKSAAESVIITDTEGLWYIYYLLGVLTASQTPWVTKDADKAMIATIHWDATNNTAIVFAYELHSYDMPPGTHNYLHETIGTQYEEGLVLSEGAGGDVGKVGITAGEVHDEDIEIDITDGAGGDVWEQVLTLPAQIPIYYRSGATAWRKYTAGDFPYYDNATADRIHYNKLNGTWASAEATNPYYVAYWLFATNDISEPIIAVMGQREDLLLANALDNNQIQNLSFGTLPFSEMKVLYRIIWKSSTAPAVADDIVDMRSVSNIPGGTYVPTPTPDLSQVVAVDGELIAGQAITSAYENLLFTFGAAGVGYNGTDSLQAVFAHRDMMAKANASLRQNSIGQTVLNAANAQSIFFQINNVNKMTMSASDLTIANGVKLIFEDNTAAEQLHIYANSSTAGDKTIEQVVDGLLNIKGYHRLRLGTNEGGGSLQLDIYPTTINVLTGKTLVFENTGTNEQLEIVTSNSSSGGATIQLINDGVLTIRGYHDLRLGTLEGGGANKLIIAPSLATFSVDVAMNGNDITSSGALPFKVSGDNDDYTELYTSGGITRLKIYESSATHSRLYLEADNATNELVFRLQEDGSNFLEFGWSQGNLIGYITSEGPLRIQTTSDTADYLEFYTSANVPRIKIIGATRCQLEGDAGSNWVVDTDTLANNFIISRIGALTQALSIGVDDRNLYFTYSQDESDAGITAVQWDIVADTTGGDNYRWEIHTVEKMKLTEAGLELGNSGIFAATILDEDDMASDLATALATQQSIKAYVDAVVVAVGSLEAAFQVGKIISGADSQANGMRVGDGTRYIAIYESAGQVYLEGVGAHLHINADTASAVIRFQTVSTTRWFFDDSGHLKPATGNDYDIGTASLDVREIYHCGLTTSSCAIFKDYSIQQLYNMLNSINYHQDGVVEEMKDKTMMPHMDMATVPDLLAHKFESYVDEDQKQIDSFERKGFFKPDSKGILQPYSIPFVDGDNVAIDFENAMWATKDLVLKLYEEIQSLKQQLATV